MSNKNFYNMKIISIEDGRSYYLLNKGLFPPYVVAAENKSRVKSLRVERFEERS